MKTAFTIKNLFHNDTVARFFDNCIQFVAKRAKRSHWRKIKPAPAPLRLEIDKMIESFANNRRGNVTLIFCLCSVVVLSVVGAAVDFRRTDMARNEMQDAADTAVLRALRMRDANDTDQLNAANSVFDSNFTAGDVTNLETNLSRQTIDNAIEQTFTASAKVSAMFGGLVGIDYYPIHVESRAQSSMVQSEIAFVLDVTGSMAGDNRLVNLKSSVDAALVSLQDDEGANLSQTKVTFVPFNTQVRLTPGTNLSYIDYGTQSVYETCTGLNGRICDIAWDVFDKVCVYASSMNDCRSKAVGSYKIWTSGARTYYSVTYKSYQVQGSGYKIFSFTETFFSEVTGSYSYGPSCNPETGVCSGGGTGTSTSFVYHSASRNDTTSSSTTVVSTVPSGFTAIASGKLYFGISNSNGYGANPETTQTSTTYGVTRIKVLPAKPDTKSSWAGCIIDRTQPYDVQATAASTATPATLYPARPCTTNSLKTMRPLSTDLVAARAFVPTLVAGGNTNITIGVQWGMEALSPSDPLTGGVAFGDDETEKFMIVVTDGQNTQNRWTSTTSTIDGRTSQACTNAKAQGITVYVVRVMEGNSTLLRNCATDADKYYDLTNASQLNDAMSSIFDSIRKARLTR